MATMRERQREVQLYRGQIPSPGRPTVAWREDRVRFWAAIARGAKTEEAGLVVEELGQRRGDSVANGCAGSGLDDHVTGLAGVGDTNPEHRHQVVWGLRGRVTTGACLLGKGLFEGVGDGRGEQVRFGVPARIDRSGGQPSPSCDLTDSCAREAATREHADRGVQQPCSHLVIHGPTSLGNARSRGQAATPIANT